MYHEKSGLPGDPMETTKDNLQGLYEAMTDATRAVSATADAMDVDEKQPEANKLSWNERMAPSPTKSGPQNQQSPKAKAKPSPSNPFYRPDMTLALAAKTIVAYFREATDWLNFWHISAPATMLVDMSRKPASTLNRIFNHFAWTAEFLRFPRKDWDLRYLPDNFFEDVLSLIMVTCGKLEKLADWKGCQVMMGKAWRDAEEIGEMLGNVKDAREREGKEKGARGLGLQGGGSWD